MGRRKIEIKAIKDDRNRSVTFLKRKGGLFKKAHELSVLCSVDVAVIIFGHNKKLYEYSSGDINETIHRFSYYQGPHEHKGPNDYAGGLDDDDEEDMGSPPVDDVGPHGNSVPPHLQPQAYLRAGTATPPPSMAGNGMAYHHPQARQHTPQPGQNLSRPGSSQGIRRGSVSYQPSQLHHVSQAPPPGTAEYAYMRGGGGYPQGPPGMVTNGGPPGGPPSQQQQNYFAQLQQASQPGGVYGRPAQEEPSPPPPHPYSHQQQQQQQQQQQPPPPPQQHQQYSTRLQQPRAAKTRSIFTPIDDSRSLLAQHWGPAKPANESRSKFDEYSSPESAAAAAPPPQQSAAVAESPDYTQPMRSDSTIATPSTTGAGGKRPKLKVHIPDEQSEDGASAAADGGSAQVTASAATSVPGARNAGTVAGAHATASISKIDPALAGASNTTRSSSQQGGLPGVVLPPPSPSGANSAMLSAGATGPPNPFARPLPPQQGGNSDRAASSGSGKDTTPKPAASKSGNSNANTRQEMETPVSALPSRFVADGLLPSPSSFYPEWGLSGTGSATRGGGGGGGGDSAILPSPLNWGQTPVAPSGGGGTALGGGSGSGEKRRKSTDGDGGAAGEGGEEDENSGGGAGAEETTPATAKGGKKSTRSGGSTATATGTATAAGAAAVAGRKAGGSNKRIKV